jgi:hypothetical protein
MEQRRTRDAGSHSLLWSPKIHFDIYNSQLLDSVLRNLFLFHTVPSCLRSILILSSYLCLGVLSGLFLLCFLAKMLLICPPLHPIVNRQIHTYLTRHKFFKEPLSSCIPYEYYRQFKVPSIFLRL